MPAELPCIALPLAPRTEFETWDAITARTPPLPGRPQRAAEDLAMIIYTSGSTGQPKGAMIDFGAVTRVGEGAVQDVRQRVGQGESRMLSYLPLAHSYERAWVGAASLVDGSESCSLPSRWTPSCRTCSARGRRCSSRCHGCG